VGAGARTTADVRQLLGRRAHHSRHRIGRAAGMYTTALLWSVLTIWLIHRQDITHSMKFAHVFSSLAVCISYSYSFS
jgi:hypothetical protein